MNISSDCVDVMVTYPEWSDNFGKDCINLTSVIEDLYGVLGDIKSDIDTSMFDNNGVDYGTEKPTVSQILRVHESEICK